MKMQALALTIILLMGCTSSAFAAEPNEKQSSDPPEAAAVETRTPAAVILEKHFRFDPVVDGAAVTHDYRITNKGEGTLEIARVKTG